MGLRSKPQMCSAIYYIQLLCQGLQGLQPWSKERRTLKQSGHCLHWDVDDHTTNCRPWKKCSYQVFGLQKTLEQPPVLFGCAPVPFLWFLPLVPSSSGFSRDFSRGRLAPNRIHPVLLTWLVGDPADGGKAGAGSAGLEDLGHSVAG